MNRYLFLDIDGVLNSERTVFCYQKLVHSNLVKGRIDFDEPLLSMFDPIAVGLLRYAQKRIGFKIVISSSWKEHLSIDEFNLIFAEYKWDTSNIIIGKTGNETGVRGNQIKSWLNTHAKYPYEYCILDDTADMLPAQEPYFVKTTVQDGLDFASFVEIFNIFDESYEEGVTLLTI